MEDNGPGIPADQMEFLFSPFVSSKKSRGTGLGLPVSQKIVREHGGKIHVHSEPGHGARFILEIPAMLPRRTTVQEMTIDASQDKTEEEGGRRKNNGEGKRKAANSRSFFLFLIIGLIPLFSPFPPRSIWRNEYS